MLSKIQLQKTYHQRSTPYKRRRHSRRMSTPQCPLLVYYDCETTGLETESDRIIEMAATVDNSVKMFVKEPKTFERFVFTTHEINPNGK